ncbi:hypothetical protein JY97_03355 [Alkalispirochaeta odontotermitis]|nr:hypothetical protein JY97_03355 [Alkalispirochaeta odontotermitis]CAB1072281.1 hypothetical protein D1AOALGA4SA_1508 [Olavius algarvensis Delta 1 endosymbiont]
MGVRNSLPDRQNLLKLSRFLSTRAKKSPLKKQIRFDQCRPCQSSNNLDVIQIALYYKPIKPKRLVLADPDSNTFRETFNLSNPPRHKICRL